MTMSGLTSDLQVAHVGLVLNMKKRVKRGSLEGDQCVTESL